MHDRTLINALLISATTLAGRGSLEHAEAALRDLFGDRRRILLINFASLPEARDAYAARMQREFQRIHRGCVVQSLHAVRPAEAAAAVGDAEGIHVSGGNTFLLLRELYDRGVVGLIRERVFSGLPYAGASAGSNIGGLCIGTTNDFPITDVPTRKALGLFAGVYNPHHPEAAEPDFESRQGKIREYAQYNPAEAVIGVTNPGMLRIRGSRLTLLGEGGTAYVQSGAQQGVLQPGESLELPACGIPVFGQAPAGASQGG